MANRICWDCGTKAHQRVYADPITAGPDSRYFMPYVCDECGVMSVAERRFKQATTSASAKAIMSSADADLTWHPATAIGKDYPDVPTHIAAAGSEAHTCHSVNAYRAAVLIARAVVEATAKDKGVTKGTLAAKIDAMEKSGIVRELVRETAHEIRFLGNDMAHGDFVTEIDEVECADVLAFMDEVLDEVYQAPARVNARRAERAARKAAQEVEGSETIQ